jgi:hypothetical protein
VSTITKSARGEECQIRIPMRCNGNRETTVWAHANGSAAGKGIGMKSHDLLGAYACHACHDLYDRRGKALGQIFSREQIELMFWQGHARSLQLLIEKGIVVMARGKAMVTA